MGKKLCILYARKQSGDEKHRECSTTPLQSGFYPIYEAGRSLITANVGQIP